MGLDIRALQKARSMQSKQSGGKLRSKPSQASSKSFSLSSYKWAHDNFANTDAERSAVQTIILDEFQPDVIFDTGQVIDSWVGAGGGKGGGSGVDFVDKALAALSSGITQASKNRIYNNLVKTYSAGGKDPINDPIEFLERMFAGYVLNNYTLPFFNNRYLHADTTQGWSVAGSERLFGNRIAKMLKDGLNVDFPTTPKWTLGDQSETLNFDFYLINDTIEDLQNNFSFLNSLVSGAYWIQLDYMQHSPNVYRVTVPGRFVWIYAAMGITVTQEGKLRKIENANVQYAPGLNADSDAMFPDAYKVVINLRNLTPENFNTYIYYLMAGQQSNKHANDSGYVKRLGAVEAASRGMLNGVLHGTGTKKFFSKAEEKAKQPTKH